MHACSSSSSQASMPPHTCLQYMHNSPTPPHKPSPPQPHTQTHAHARHGTALQVERAIEVEVNTGPATKAAAVVDDGDDDDDYSAYGAAPTARPAAAVATARPAAAALGPGSAAAAAAAKGGAGAGGGDDDDEYDPLDAFMSGIEQEVAANKPTARPKPGNAAAACDEEADPGAEYMQAKRRAGAAVMAAPAAAAGEPGDGYDSDQEVYATAK